MMITFTPEHESIIQAQLATGQLHSVKEVLDKVLAPFKPQAQAVAERLREPRKGITLHWPEGMSLREYAHRGHKY